MKGTLKETYRLPMCPPAEDSRKRIRAVLQELGIL